jgi:hypothetical protein
VIDFEPESWQWGSGSFALRVGGGSQEWAVAMLGAHTPSKNPRPVSWTQAYIACLHSRGILRTSDEDRARLGFFNLLDTSVTLVAYLEER